jgi:hypothetical protein
MPRYDLPSRTGPQTLICYRDGREYRFTFPYVTTDPAEMRILRQEGVPICPAPRTAPVAAPVAAPAPEPEEKPKTRKGGDA